MKRKKEVVFLVLIIAALSAYLAFQKADKTHYRLPEVPKINKEDVTRITIQKGDSELTLELADDRWLILPEGYPADGSAIESILEIIEGLRLTAMVSTSENYSPYDLDDRKRIQVTAFNGDDLLVSVEIGKIAPSLRHTFVKLQGDRHIYHAEKNFRSRFDKDRSALRDKQVMKIDEEISEIILTAGKQSLQVLRATAPVEVDLTQEGAEDAEGEGAQGTPRWETVDGKPVKEKEIDTLVKTLSNLKCDDYIEGKSKEEYKDPSFHVSLRGLKDYELSLYSKQENKFVTTSSESAYPFLISEWKAKKIKKDLDDLMEPEE